MGLSLNANAVKVHINSGNPAYPFPQFLKYACGGNLGTKLPEGLSHAEMELQIREAYQLHANAFEYTGDEWAGIKYIKGNLGCPYDCTECDGYALLAAAYMADKPTFDGLWMRTHDLRRYRTKKYSDCKPTGESYEYGPFSLGDNEGDFDSAADGDEDVALALYVAYKQWGEFMLDEKGEKVLDACGNPISYKQELIEVVRGLVALSTRFAGEKGDLRVNSGMIGLDGYVKGGNTWGEVTKWASENPTVFSDSMTVYNMSAEGTVNVEGISLIPEFGGSNQHHIDYNAPAYYREFHDLLLSLSKELGVTNEWEAEQFRRAEASSDWLIGQLIAKNPYSVPTAGWCTVNNDGSETTFDNFNVGEDFRTPWRNISNYVWHGNPKYSWNPATHKVEERKNGFEYDAAVRLSNYMNDPMNWNDSLENSCYRFGEPSIPISGPKTMSWIIDPMTGVALDQRYTSFSVAMQKGAASFAAIGAQDYNLMGELYNNVYSIYDVKGTTDDGERIPVYMHGWFRQLGLMALTGNYAAPSQMEASSNLKIYRSIKDSVSSCRVGDTITYILSYRNYGSKDATDVVIVDTLPNDFQLVSVSDGGVYSPVTNEIWWSLGDVPGFKSDSTEGAALDFSAPNLSKTMGQVYYKCVVKPGASGRYSLNATIYSKGGKESKTNEYPNYVTSTMQRNTIDIIPNTLSVTKSADRDTVKKDDVVEFTIAYSNTDSLPFLTGGRSRVNFTVAGNYERNQIHLNLRLNNDAIEPFINAGNYRVTHYIKSTKEEDDELLFENEIAEGLSNSIGKADIGFSTVDLSDSIVGCRIQLSDYLTSNTIFLSWFPVSTIRDLKGGLPIRLLRRIHTSRFTDFYDSDWWSKLEPADDEELFYPVSPSYQIPDSIVDVDKVIYSACDNSDVVTETVLVEEYDGHTWRKILGEAPYNGIEAEDVLITDSIPLGFEFVSFVGDSTGATYEAISDADFASGVVRYRADKLKIGEKGSFGYKCRYTGPVSGGSYVTSAIMESKNEKVKSTMHLIVDDLSSAKQTVNEDGDAPVDVYNAQGQLLKRQVSPDQALEGLSKGVYMVGNKKKVVTK
ncbi:MAG: glycosyl hydrolase family 8 [Paludibacteraceae bacterium]|nr:glycosyl hydrolase family 8 [Paludibacteraceae bacterium]